MLQGLFLELTHPLLKRGSEKRSITKGSLSRRKRKELKGTKKKRHRKELRKLNRGHEKKRIKGIKKKSHRKELRKLNRGHGRSMTERESNQRRTSTHLLRVAH